MDRGGVPIPLLMCSRVGLVPAHFGRGPAEMKSEAAGSPFDRQMFEPAAYWDGASECERGATPLHRLRPRASRSSRNEMCSWPGTPSRQANRGEIVFTVNPAVLPVDADVQPDVGKDRLNQPSRFVPSGYGARAEDVNFRVPLHHRVLCGVGVLLSFGKEA